jgi:putative two-component system response regulator
VKSLQGNLGSSLYHQLDVESRRNLNSSDATAHAWFSENRQAVLSDAGGEPCGEQVEALLRFVQWHFKGGDYQEALGFAIKAVELTTALDLRSLLRRSLNLLGLVHTNLGNFTEATVAYADALHIADEIGDRTGRAAVLGNLATLRFNAGLIEESIELNQYVLNITDGEPQYQGLAANAHHNIAAASLLLKDLSTARAELTKAESLLPHFANQFLAFQRVIFDSTWCKLLLHEGRSTEAQGFVERAEKLALEMESRAAQAQASIARALLEAGQGHPKEALKRLDSVRARIAMDEPVYRDLLEVEAICTEKLGDDTQAALLWMKFLSHTASFQRRFVIRQVAAFQQNLRDSAGQSFAHADPTHRGAISIGRSRKIQTAIRQQLEALASLADHRESARARHSERVGRIVERLAIELGYRQPQSETVGLAARLHDIGKLTIPDVLLLKTEKLTSMELELVRRHTVEGSQILVDILATMERLELPAQQTESLRTAADIALHHHEWWDGSGYPRQIAGERISEPARLTALADTFDELTAPRTYKRPHKVAEALHAMASLSGRQFEPRLFVTFERLIQGLQSQYGQELERFSTSSESPSVYQRAFRVIDALFDSPPPVQLRSNVPESSNSARPELTIVAENR